ncbi:MAG: transglycosylase SLT domain-containing protein [Acidobacteria bacterium]|nr:transglycosylase SLT domain-containing protein [Acidobacteriota bacterium]
MNRLNASLSLALCLALSSGAVSAQTPQANFSADSPSGAPRVADSQTQAVIDRAQYLFEMGETAFRQNDLDRARRAFDDSIDAILVSNIDIRRNEPLQSYYRELIEKIHRHQMSALNLEADGFADQAYVPAESELASLSATDLASLGDGQLASIDGDYDFNFTVDAPVFQFISYFTAGRGRGTMESGLRRSGRYRKMAEKIFKEENVPTDLIWLAQVESVWKPAALSHAAAKGIWQFIPSTGRRFGLDQDAWVDERSDPEMSTRAAARYLKFLHNYFGDDWLLAMAAYNSGEGNVSKAIARSGYADFWEIHRAGFLPNETRNYVPAILAVIIVANNQKRYNFSVTPESELKYDLAQVTTQTDLDVVAELCSTSPDVIRDLNPHLRRDMTPPGAHYLKVPNGRRKDFETAWAALSPAERLGRTVEPADDELASSDSDSSRPRSVSGFGGGNSTVAYRTKAGDTLSSVASRHGISTTELARVNRIPSNADLVAGQEIRIPAKPAMDRYVDKPVRKASYRAKTVKPSAKSSKSKQKSAPKKSKKRR